MKEKKHIVITGGSRGIGYGLALEFLKLGHRVSISGRNRERLDIAVKQLSGSAEENMINGFACNASNISETDKLWEEAVSKAPVDIWINNAGINHETCQFHELELGKSLEVIDTNINGTVIASNIAIKNMLNQGYGAVYNMEGFGSDGRIIKGMGIYGMTKRAIRYFTNSLAVDYKSSGILIGSISPGMVITDMITGHFNKNPEEQKDAMKIFHTLSDTVETVTPWLVERILKNKKQGAHIAWLTGRKIMWRFFSNIFIKRKVPGLPDV